MEPVQQVVSRLKDFVKARGVDFETELYQYDIKRNGVISTVSLHRWIASLGISLSNRNIQQLILGFQKENGVDAYALIEALNSSGSFNETMKARPPECPAELMELGKELARRRQNLREALSPYDRMNSGRVSSNNFYRAFGATPVTRIIVNAYAISDEIDYNKLAQDVKEASSSVDMNQFQIPEQTAAFADLATYIKSHDIDARMTFSRQDRLNTGKMQKRQFYAVLASFGANMQPLAYKEIAQSFEDGSGACNYFVFLQALDAFVPPPPKATSRTFEIPEELAKAADPEHILASTKSAIEGRRIDIEAQFAQCDRECTGGQIPLQKFIRILQAMKIGLSVDDIEAIAKLFPGQYGTVKYQDFISAVSPKVQRSEATGSDVIEKLKKFMETSHVSFASSASRFDREGSGNISVIQLASALQFLRFECTNPELAALRDEFRGTAPRTVNWVAISALVDVKKEEPAPEPVVETPVQKESAPPPEQVSRVIEKIATGVQQRGMSLYDEFRVSDRFRKGAVTQQTFLAMLYALPIQLSPVDVRTVTSYYKMSGSSDINYVILCRDLKKIEENRMEQQRQCLAQTGRTRTMEIEVDIPETVHQFMKRFKNFCGQMRLNINDIFGPYDVGHNGTLPVFKVQACFNNVNFPVLRQEIEQLVVCFRDVKKPELFNYVNFDKALKKEDISSETARASLSSAPISTETEREALITCGQIREKLMARHRRIEIAFAEVTTPTVSVREFQSRLASVDLVLRAGQITALLRKYRVNLSDQIDWKAFCADVTSSKTIGA